jgi:hypothetical protein
MHSKIVSRFTSTKTCHLIIKKPWTIIMTSLMCYVVKKYSKDPKKFIDHGTMLSCGKIHVETLVMLMAFWKKHCPNILILIIQKLMVLPFSSWTLKSFNDFCLCLFIPIQMHHVNLLVQGEKMSNAFTSSR